MPTVTACPTVPGSACASPGGPQSGAMPNEGRLNAALQSGAAGLSITGGPTSAPIAPGDSLVAAGRLEFRNGQLHLATEGYAVVPGPGHEPAPRQIVLANPMEPYEGMLVQIEGTAVGTRRIPVGTVLMLAADDSLLYALAFGDRGAVLFEHVQPGERVRVTGVLGQHDQRPPYRQGYQIYPATRADVKVVGLGASLMRLVLLLVATLLLGALLVIVFLMRRNHRRLMRQLQTENRYRVLFDNTDDAAFLHEVVGDYQEMRLLAANAAAGRLFNLPLEAFHQRPPRSFLADPALAVPMMQAIAHEGRLLQRVEMRTPDGRSLMVEMDAFQFVENGRPTVLTLLTDVTQRAAYEQGLIEARERAEAYARMQESFVANMSHEIRTPLTGIIGFADVLREELDGEHQGFAEMIESGARHLLGTLDSVLELARIEAQGDHLSLHPMDLARTLRETTGMLRAVARQSAIDLDVDAPEALVAYGNASAFGRVVSNLVGNALKFTSGGGRVYVRLTTEPGEPPEAVLTVQDTGIGISEAFQAQLFQPFSQEATGDHRPHGGTGLGLALSLRLVTLLGGTIAVYSQKGNGATFTVRLPCHVPAYLQGEPAATHATPTAV